MKPVNRTLQIAWVILLSRIACGQALPDKQIANRLEAYLNPFVETRNFQSGEAYNLGATSPNQKFWV